MKVKLMSASYSNGFLLLHYYADLSYPIATTDGVTTPQPEHTLYMSLVKSRLDRNTRWNTVIVKLNATINLTEVSWLLQSYSNICRSKFVELYWYHSLLNFG